jgi:hypothetical protein
LETSINEIIPKQNITVSPNPIGDYAVFNLNLETSETVEIAVYNTSGICLLKKKYPNHQKEIILNMADCPPGVYLYRIMVGDEIRTKKIIKL